MYIYIYINIYISIYIFPVGYSLLAVPLWCMGDRTAAEGPVAVWGPQMGLGLGGGSESQHMGRGMSLGPAHGIGNQEANSY